MMHDWNDGWGWHGMGLGWLFWIVVIGLVVWLAIMLARSAGGRDVRVPDEPARSAREILDERLARGEIDDQEYARKRKLLDGKQ